MWDPGQYRKYGDERSRPFFDLTGRVQATDPHLVLDLGCGPGELTATLAGRWPGTRVLGVDSSAAMIESARQLGSADGRLSFALGDVSTWQPAAPADVLVANAVLQWLPDQIGALTRWAGLLADDGWLAVQLPGNYDQPGHTVMREMADSVRWKPQLSGLALNRQAMGTTDYLETLLAAGCAADVWETTYLHVLTGENPVLEWYKGTGLRPVIDALPADDAAEFLAEYGERVRAAYPARSYGTVLPFRRVFMVAQRRC